MKKKGVSQIISTMIIITLTIVAIGAVWKSVNSFVHKNLDNSCEGIYDELKFNSEYTCYDRSNDVLVFSISRKEKNFSAILISIVNSTTSKSYALTEQAQEIENIKNYNGSLKVAIPGIQEGVTYCSNNFPKNPNKITLYPQVNKKNCQGGDSVNPIRDCSPGISCSFQEGGGLPGQGNPAGGYTE